MQAGIKQIILVGIGFLSFNALAMDPGEELQEAAYEGKTLLVEQLLSAGTDPDGSTVFSPLYCALLNDQDNAVEKLLDGGATIDHNVFGLAAELGRIDILERGLQNPEFDINFPAPLTFTTALKIAKLYKQEEVQNLLIDNGATEDL